MGTFTLQGDGRGEKGREFNCARYPAVIVPGRGQGELRQTRQPAASSVEKKNGTPTLPQVSSVASASVAVHCRPSCQRCRLLLSASTDCRLGLIVPHLVLSLRHHSSRQRRQKSIVLGLRGLRPVTGRRPAARHVSKATDQRCSRRRAPINRALLRPLSRMSKDSFREKCSPFITQWERGVNVF